LKRIGLEKARLGLSSAFEEFETLKTAQTWERYERSWSGFLSALAAVYEILRKSSQGDARSERWFKKIDRVRKSEASLAYLQKARNVNDHGVDYVLEKRPSAVGIGRGQSIYIEKMVVEGGLIVELRGNALNGAPLDIEFIPEGVQLTRVESREGPYDPPTAFFEEALPERSPIALAAKVLEYMVLVFVEAEGLLAQDQC
jgi:hypothetical protein